MSSSRTAIALAGAWMEEQSLVARAKRGDERAFEELMKQFERPILALCYRALGQGGEAEEVAQDVFFKLYKSIGQLEEERRIEPWLFRVAMNACRDRLRRRKPVAELTDSVASVAARGDVGLILQDVREALDRLPDRERAALILREVEGLETEEVAARMGTSPVTVRSQVAKARARLRSWLGGVR